MNHISIEQRRNLAPIIAAIMPAAPPAPPKRPSTTIEPQHREFFELVDGLVALNMRHRRNHVSEFKHMEPGSFAEMFSTVRVFAGRRTGATAYIRERATENDLVIVASGRARDRDYRPYGLPCRVATPDEVLKSAGFGRERYGAVYIDDPALVFSATPQHRLLYELSQDTQQTFILLGI